MLGERLEAMKNVITKIEWNRSDHSQALMLSSLDSSEMNRLVDAFRICAVSVSLRERQVMAQTATTMVCQFASFGNDAVTNRLVEVPGLLSSLARLWGEEVIRKNSDRMLEKF